MGWFWGNPNTNDPVKKLDPQLREYLEHETSKYAPTTQIPPPESTKPAEASQGTTQGDETNDNAKPVVPSASLFPDGRYAHLWKTYKPPHETESHVRGVERVIESYKQRKDTVHRAAMENCALEQEALTFCFQNGNFQQRMKARLTMCSAENSKFSRCFTMQSKFLQALGYAAALDWDEEREERIQMHADKLYHQMLDYEKRVEEATGAGLEPPLLTSLFQPDTVKASQPISTKTTAMEVPGEEEIPASLKLSKTWAELTPHERELEVRLYNAQIEQQKVYEEAASPFIKSQEEARTKRREKAVGWFGETIGKWIT